MGREYIRDIDRESQIYLARRGLTIQNQSKILVRLWCELDYTTVCNCCVENF